MPNLIFLNWVFVDLIRPPTKKFQQQKKLFGALKKIGDWIQKYVQIHLGF